MRQFLASFRTYLEVETGLGSGTVDAYLGDLTRFRSWLDNVNGKGKIPRSWEEIEASDLRAYLTHLVTERKKKVSAKYVHRVTSSFRNFFDFLQNIEKARRDNPARELQKPKLPKRHPITLEPEEVAMLVKAALMHCRISERVRNWTLVAVLYNTGLRISELCSMKISTLRYREGMPRSFSIIGKGNKERKIALNDEASRALITWLKERRRLGGEIFGDAHDSVWIIPTGAKKGSALTPGGVRAMLRFLANKAGIKKPVTPHKLRHSFATEAVRSGAKLNVVQEMLGHSSIATTGIYLHADEREIEEASSIIPGVANFAV